MSAPLVSIVIASYQHVAYVRQALESVLEQTVRDIEVIVVDDGSTDGTPELVESIRDHRLRLVRLQENRREHARNIGLSLASGRYVAFQNSDDEWAPEKLAAQLELLEAREDVAICFTEVDLIDPAGQPAQDTWANGLFATGETPQSADQWLHRLFFSNQFCIISAMARRHLVEQAGRFRPSLVQLSDLDLWIRLASLGEMVILPQRLTRMRVDGSRNLSAPSPAGTTRACFEMADVLEYYVRSPLIERAHKIFPELSEAAGYSLPVRKALLARTAGLHSAMSHHLFADRVLARMIDHPQERQELVNALGSQAIHFFLKNRSRIGAS
ncbi:glycosyltransferase [Ottowia thiooxydans]|uniref:glycosyltransferase n=1 Tax=Ottowia thiooxydans TaxID=219182 RepID=UPI0003F56655|nr:glycosyltransferase [Ottowia thiooxydans]